MTSLHRGGSGLLLPRPPCVSAKFIMSRSRAWVFTHNNYASEDVDRYEDMSYLPATRYLCFGEETGAEGTAHIQGYIAYNNARTATAVRADFPGAHVEAAKGSAQQNKEYCEKEGHFFENGDMPMTSADGGEMEKVKWVEAKALAQAGNLDDIDPRIYVTSYRTLKAIAKDHMVMPAGTDGVTGVWFYGPSGAGKSREARQRYPGAYLKMCNKWWDGYQGEANIIIEDFDKAHSGLCHHLKIWADRYSFMAEDKGGAMAIRPAQIVVTSNYHPNQIWTDQADLEPILRRFSVTHFDMPFGGAWPELDDLDIDMLLP